MKAAIRFLDARLERCPVRDRLDLLVSVVATIEVVYDDRLLYSEVEFPIVELRVELERWLHEGFHDDVDFEFESMETDVVGLVWFRRVASGWRLGSAHQEFAAVDPLSERDVTDVVTRFADDVDSWLRDHLHLDPRAYD